MSDRGARDAEEAGGEEAAHDVLAAEEFGVGSGDPVLHEAPAHDVLAAEEFGVGSGAPELHAPRSSRRRRLTAAAPAIAAAFAAVAWRRRSWRGPRH